MIEYDVIRLLKILLKKWYVIVLFAIIFSVLSVPLAKKSYNDAITYYNKQIDSQKEYVEAATEYSNLSFCVLKVEGKNDSDLNNVEAASIVYGLLRHNSIKEIIYADMQERELQEEILNQYSVTLLGESNWILIDSMSLSEEEFCQVIDCIEGVLRDKLTCVIGKEMNLQFGEVSFQQIVQQDTKQQNDTFEEMIIKKPSEHTSYIKTFITSGLLGMMIGILIIFIIEYIKENRKLQ